MTLMVLASLAWCVAYCLGTVHHWPAMSPQDRANFDPAQSSVLGVAGSSPPSGTWSRDNGREADITLPGGGAGEGRRPGSP